MEVMENVVDVGEVLLDEPADKWVSRKGFIPTICCLIACCGPLNATVIHEGPGNIWDLGLKDKGNVFIKYGAGIHSALWQTG